MPALKTWIEVNKSAIASNVKVFRGLVKPETKIWAVAKSNAYGHGFTAFALAANEAGVDGFCVDSVPEALKLRHDGITKPILVVGSTLPSLFADAAAENVTLSFSTRESFTELIRILPDASARPEIHIKVDTGMHRRGFYPEELSEIAKYCIANQVKVTGVFSHFAAAKDTTYLTYSLQQFEKFTSAISILESAGLTGLMKHISATGGTLIDARFHLDAVRIGIGLYGLFPSKELEAQKSNDVKLIPALSWRAVISEIKNIPKDEFVGYDLTERLNRNTTAAIIPIGYWHGIPWVLSGNGEVLIEGKRCKVLGRVTMDMITVDVTDVNCKTGDIATIIGEQADQKISARDMAGKAGTSPYEIITRLNPLIERSIV